MKKPQLSNSLHKLLKGSDKKPASQIDEWITLLSAPQTNKDTLMLSRGGEAAYSSLLLEAQNSNNKLQLIIDNLLPEPEEDIWDEQVTFQAKIATFDAGIEELIFFYASLGEKIEYEERGAVVLDEVWDLTSEKREYIAELAEHHPVELGFIWYGDWINVKPDRITISRLFFDVKLDGEIGDDGYAIPKATLKLDDDGAEIPVKLRLYRHRNGGFEVHIEKIDGIAKQKLTSIVEEIWRIASGLSQRKNKYVEKDVSYVVKEHDVLSEAFEPGIILLAERGDWKQYLSEQGNLTVLDTLDLTEIAEKIGEKRCDLIVGDADLWGEKAIQVERLLRSVSQFRKIPRIWFTETIEKPQLFSFKPEVQEEDEEAELDEMDLDLIDYGAIDLLPSSLNRIDSKRRILWALNKLKFSEGKRILLVSQDSRLIYRLGLALNYRSLVNFSVLKISQGITAELDSFIPEWILLDGDSFEVELETMLSLTVDWADQHGVKVFILARGAGQEKITKWLKAGARDIIILDPSLRLAANRLYGRIHGKTPV